VALGGTSYATVLQVPRASVGTPQLKRNAVTPQKIAPNAVRTGHVLNGPLLVADFKAGQIPQGPKGDKGDTGAAGAAGAPGVAGLETASATSAANATDFKDLTVDCPSGRRVLGGGIRLTGADGFVAVDSSRPFDPRHVDRSRPRGQRDSRELVGHGVRDLRDGHKEQNTAREPQRCGSLVASK
jgi:hypothetical protein